LQVDKNKVSSTHLEPGAPKPVEIPATFHEWAKYFPFVPIPRDFVDPVSEEEDEPAITMLGHLDSVNYGRSGYGFFAVRFILARWQALRAEIRTSASQPTATCSAAELKEETAYTFRSSS
jgi:hypothetical protein